MDQVVAADEVDREVASLFREHQGDADIAATLFVQSKGASADSEIFPGVGIERQRCSPNPFHFAFNTNIRTLCLYAAGNPVIDIAADMKVHRTTIYRRRKKAEKQLLEQYPWLTREKLEKALEVLREKDSRAHLSRKKKTR